MLTDFDREQLSDQMASLRSKMNFICDLLSMELLEASIESDPNTKQEREQALERKVRDLQKVTEYYIMNHKLVSLKSREGYRVGGKL